MLSTGSQQQRGLPLSNKRVVVLGAARSGLSAARLAKQAGAEVSLLERSPSIPEPEIGAALRAAGIELEQGPHTPNQFQGAELVILSPGIAEQNIAGLLPASRRPPVYSELELASWFVRDPVIAVTGSNGKTTTVSLIAKIFRDIGKQVFLGGNIGIPLSEYVLQGQPADVLVLEVSSFQLQHTWTFHPQVAVFLNFYANHLDYHEDLDAYWRAKMNIFANQQEGDTMILPSAWAKEVARESTGRASKTYLRSGAGYVCPALRGAHNQENMEAAVLACACFGVERAQAAEAIRTYPGLPHRMQMLGAIRGLRFVNDSKATTVEAQAAALRSFREPVLLLAGGKLKGGHPQRLESLVAERVKVAGLFGASREIFEKAWGDSVPMFWKPSLEAAFQKIVSLGVPGDVVLLSPGTASFDLFENYEHRGQAFIDLVNGLESLEKGL